MLRRDGEWPRIHEISPKNEEEKIIITLKAKLKVSKNLLLLSSMLHAIFATHVYFLC